MRQKQFLLAFLAMLLCFAAPSFAQVAKIGGTGYETLQAAMTEANKAAGDYTITLLQNSAEVFTFAQKSGVNITIDGDQKIFSGQITLNSGKGNLTFTDAKIAPANSQSIYLNASTAPNVTFDGCTLQGANKSGAIVYGYASATSNSVTVKNCTADNLGYIVSHRQTGAKSVLVENVTATNMLYFLRTLKCASVTVKNVTVDAVIGIEVRSDVKGTTTFENVTFNSALYNGDYLYIISDHKGAGNMWTINLKGDNSFTKNSVAYTGDSWIYGFKSYVLNDLNIAKVGEKTYATLEKAVAAAQAGETVKLLKNATGAGVVINKDITIDFNGKTYSFNKGVGSTGTESNGFQILKGNNVTLKNGTLNVAESDKDKFYILVQNYANLTVEDMNLDGTNLDKWSATDGDSYVLSNNSGNVLVKGNTNITANNEGDKAFAFDACTKAGYTAPVVTIETTGTIDGQIENSAKIVIKSGTFTTPLDASWFEAGYSCRDNGDGTYGVAVSAIKIGDKYYETLAEALAAANAGDTITFMADVTENVTISKSLTIDGAGKTFTGNIQATNKKDVVIKNVNFDGKGYNGYAVEAKGAYNITIEDCTAKNYGYGFLQNANGTVSTTVKNVTIEGVNYGVKVDYANTVVLENVDITAGVAAVLNSNYGEKTITVKNSKLNILGTWTRNNTTKTTYVFEGANTIDSFIIDAAIDNFKLAADATLTAPEKITMTTDISDYDVRYKDGKYYLVEVEAKVDNKKYETLAMALDKAQAGQTVTLLREITASEIITINKAITLDGNGKKLTSTAARAINVDNANGATIKNLTINASDERAINVINKATNVTIEKVTATAANYTVNLAASAANAVVAIKDSNLTGLNVVNVAAAGAKVTVDGTTLVCNDQNANESYAAIAVNKESKDATVVVKNSEFDIKGDSAKVSNGAEGATITIDGVEAGNKIVAVIEYEGTDNYYSFYTLADAVAKAQAGETVKLIADATGAGVVINKSITIDFNGKTYTANEGVGSAGTETLGLQILKGNTVTLKNGTLTSAGDKVKMLVQNYANLTVDNMKLVDATDVIQYVLSNNCGNVVVKNASEITADGAIAFDACKYANYALPTVTIEEGVVVTGDVEVSATLNFAGTLDGKIIINGAEGVVNSTVEGLNVTTTIEGRNVVYTNGVYTTAEFEPVAKVNGKNYASLREAVDAAPAGATVYLLKDVTLEGGYEDATEGLRIEKAITIKGQDHTINCGKFSKGIRVYNQSGAKSIVSFYNLTIVNNNAAGRCIDTRSGNIDLLLYLSNLKATGTNSQPLTLGGQDRLYRVRVQGGSIDAGKSGYGIISFVPSWAGITCSTGTTIKGFAAVYLKDGANGISLSLDKGTYTATNSFAQNSGVFGAVVVEGDNNTIAVKPDAVVKAVSANGANMAQQAVFLIKEGATGNTITIASDKVKTEGDRACVAMVATDVVASTTITGKQLVAECGGYQFISVDDAIRCADTGNTVKLLANDALDTKKLVAQNDGYATLINVKDKAITLDLNGKTINVEAKASDLANTKGGMLLSVFHADTNGQLTLVDSSDAQTGAVNVLAKDAKVYCLAASESQYTDKTNSGKIIVNGGTYTLDRADDSMFFSDANEVITINGGNFTLGNVGTGSNGMPWIFNTYERNERHVNVNGGTFNADINHQYWAFEVNVPETRALRNNGNGTWTMVYAEAWVLEKYNASYNRKVGYATLEEALAVSNNVNNTVTLAKDVEVVDMITVDNGKTLVLNLNGKTIAATDNTSKNYSAIDNRGDLTITGEGKMTVKATVNSGWNRYSAVIANNPGGKLTVNGGTIEHLGGTDMAYGIDNLTNGKGTYAETIINGGTIKSTYRAIRQFLNGTEADNILTVNGGTIEGTNKSIFFHDPSAKANNGTLTVGEEATLKGDVYLFVTAGSTEWPVEVMIAKDALEGESTVVPANVPEGYAVTAYSDKWVVEQTKLATLTISDDCDSYENIVKKTVGELTYVRNFENEQWQTIYLPFAMHYADVKDEFEVAYIYNAKYLDNEATIDYVVITDDNYELEANRPYLIRAKEEGVKSIVVENATLMPTAVKSIDCSSVYETFTFTGNYSLMDSNSVDIKSNKGYFTLNEEGEWGLFDGLNPFRAYMTIELRNGKPFTSGNIIMRKVDKNGNVDTSVEKIGVDADILGIYDLQGRRVLEPQKGEIYIINGKKVVF